MRLPDAHQTGSLRPSEPVRSQPSPADPEQGRTGRLDSLTSLRWFAALIVFGRHTSGLMDGTSFGGTWNSITSPGATGVSFFFLLSGFVLTWTHRAEDPARAFYRRRFARIAPSYLVIAAISIPVFSWVRGFTVARLAAMGFAGTALQSWIPSQKAYFAGNGVLWSVSDEAFFYLMFPIVGAWVIKQGVQRIHWIAVAAIAFSVALPCLVRSNLNAQGIGYWAIYIFPVYRFSEFVLGICVCLLVKRQAIGRIPVPFAVALTVAAYVIGCYVPLWTMWVSVTLIPYALLVASCAQADVAHSQGGISRILRSRPLIRLGEWSFAFYLVHDMVISVCVRVIGMRADDIAARTALILVCLAVAISAAWALHRFVERPWERRLRIKTPTAGGAHSLRVREAAGRSAP